MMTNKCPIHNCDWKLIPAGVSKKTGRPYVAFYVCPVQDCKEKPPKDESSQGKFVKELDTSAAMMNQQAKDKLITRTAIIKSMLERGDHYSLDFVKEFEALLALAENRSTLAQGIKTAQIEENPLEGLDVV